MKIKGYTHIALTESDIGTLVGRDYVYLSGESAYSTYPVAKWNVDGSDTQIYRPATMEEFDRP